MLTLRSEKIFIRALEPEDLDFLFEVENNEEFWEVSATSAPFSRFILKQYLENSHKDIYEAKQLRLMICTRDKVPVGMIDLFDFDPRNQKTALGILICKTEDRKKGYGSEALELIKKYCFKHLCLHQIYAHVGIENEASKALFEKGGFQKTGQKKDWNLVNGNFKDELLYQMIRDVY